IMTRARLLTAARAATVVVLAAGAAIGGYAITAAVHPAKSHPTLSRTPAALRGATSVPSLAMPPSAPAAPAAATVRHAVASLVAVPALGNGLRARIVDVATGAVLYDHSGGRPGAP